MNTEKLKEFNAILNAEPDPETLGEHEGFKFVPIEIVEQKLIEIFHGLVQYEIRSFVPFLNEFICHSRIRVFHPVIGEWMNYDGIGAGMFEQKPGTSVKDFTVHKAANGARMTVPLAYAESIKVAAKKIGNVFGANVNRKAEDGTPKKVNTPKAKATKEQMKSETVFDLISHCHTIEQLTKVEEHLQEEHVSAFLKRKEQIEKPDKIQKLKRKYIPKTK